MTGARTPDPSTVDPPKTHTSTFSITTQLWDDNLLFGGHDAPDHQKLKMKDGRWVDGHL